LILLPQAMVKLKIQVLPLQLMILLLPIMVKEVKIQLIRILKIYNKIQKRLAVEFFRA
jgi:hypothetical protein